MAANALPAIGSRVAFVNARTQGLQTAIVKAVYPPLQDGTIIVAIMLEDGGGRQEVPLAVLRDPPNP
ncbi:hypothetical protein BU17DRAFT_98408 [Hysterangium stoloniferum]|nr:hypothetical protein BU17DRAFT_98408 [Hysterangium stoloniferum]